MDVNNVNWISQLFETIRIIAVAFIPIVILYFNYKARAQERKNDLLFRAREHLYQSLQDDIKSSDKSLNELSHNLGYLLGMVSSSDDENQLKSNADSCRRSIRILETIFKKTIPLLETELNKNDLLDDQIKSEIRVVKETFSRNIDEVLPNEMEKQIRNYINAIIVLNVLQNMISEKKRDQVFEDIMKMEFK